MFQTSRTTNRLLSSCVGVVLALAGTLQAQDSSTQQSTTSVDIPPPGTSTIELPRPQDFEVGLFAGASFFKQKEDPLQTVLLPSAMVGGWVAENFSKYLGTEQSFAYSQNDLQFRQSFGGVLQKFTLTERLFHFQDSLLVHFRAKDEAVRPYLAAGFGLISYRPTDNARSVVTSPVAAPLSAAGLDASTKFAFTYGGGMKVKLSDHFGLRAEARGVLSREPHYGLPQTGVSPQIFIPSGGIFNGLQVTAGMYFAFGGKQILTLTVQKPWTSVSIAASGNNVCPGTTLTVKANIEGRQPFAVPNYRWTLDGKDSGTNTDTFTVPGDAPGQHQIGLTVVDSNTLAKSVVPPVTVTINQHTPPTITANAEPTALDLDKGPTQSKLYPHPQAGSCPGNLTVTWSASEGSVSGTDPATYDAAGVQVDPGQTKQVTVTATVTDDKGGSASAPVTLTVTRNVQSVGQPDVVFPTGNSRVNNCGKRVLIDQVYPALTSGQFSNYDVLLVGHAGSEPMAQPAGRRRGRRAAAAANAGDLARERAENVAKILASGQGICPKPGIDVSRIKIATVGAGVDAPPVNSPCVGSTQDRERRGARVAGTADELRDQRVQIILVPKGANLPPYASNAQQAPDSVRANCPK